MFKVFYLSLMILIISIVIDCSGSQLGSKESICLRSEPVTLSAEEAKRMIIEKGFFDKYWNRQGGFENRYESKKIEKVQVVIDYATGLIWHQSGSEDFLNLKEALEWVRDLNNAGYAGQVTWRLPTLEEALSLMENEKLNRNLYIDPAFDGWQWCILTGDVLDSQKNWLVSFSGRVDWFDSNVRINYVRPVCTIN
jgi:hypothetical protein